MRIQYAIRYGVELTGRGRRNINSAAKSHESTFNAYERAYQEAKGTKEKKGIPVGEMSNELRRMEHNLQSDLKHRYTSPLLSPSSQVRFVPWNWYWIFSSPPRRAFTSLLIVLALGQFNKEMETNQYFSCALAPLGWTRRMFWMEGNGLSGCIHSWRNLSAAINCVKASPLYDMA